MSPPTKRAAKSFPHRLLAAPLALFRSAPWTRQILAILVVAVLLIAGSLGVWGKVRPHVQSQAEYLVPLADIEITPAPAWIHANIRAEVVRDSGLPHKLSILDDRLSDRLSHAFALHPWIERVDQVRTSYPAHIQVNLSYRKPVAMVVVYGGLLPIDTDGVLLPTEDFTPQEANKYPRVMGIKSSPLGPIGTRWGDSQIEAAAKLAELLAPQWQALHLHHILVEEQNSLERGHYVEMQLVTQAGTKFVWGSAIGQEADDEIDSATKMKRLEQFAAGGGLDAVADQSRDLRK